MKSLMTIVLQFIKDRPTRMNIIALFRFLLFVTGLVTLYSIVFHYILEYEGRSESWITGFYWTLTVMTTLGFGDITFESDLGKLFSTLVLLSGIVFFLILLPFTFIEFFYAPWMQAQQNARTPRELPEKTKNHAILTHFDAVTKTLIDKLKLYHYTYVLILDDVSEAVRLHDIGYRVMVGNLDDPQTYRQARVDQALFVAATASDQANVNVAFTVREISQTVPIIATANQSAAVDILQLAGCSTVLEVADMLGQALVRQVTHDETSAHVIFTHDNLHIAEASVRGTSLVKQTLRESRVRELTGVNVLGMWTRGHFELAQADGLITSDTILMLAGSQEQLAKYDELYSSRKPLPATAEAIIIGGGRVGRAVARALVAKGINYRIVEKAEDRVRKHNADRYVVGDGAELEVLEEAGIRETNTVIVTTHDDNMNVYLTIYCRRLRPEAQIISRAVYDRNIVTLHRAGADFVMSYASTGANAIINSIGRDHIMMIAEGLDLFEVSIPDSMVGKTIAECNIRKKTGSTLVALNHDGHSELMPDPHRPLPADVRLILIGTPSAEERFLKTY
ncbi:MAG: potassium channel family protein [Anaerolineae bacterium]